MKEPKIIIYTDGACSGNPGPGAWAYAIDYGAKIVMDHGLHKDTTTNNRMELTAVIQALKNLKAKRTHPVTLKTDSRYVEQGINRNLANWKSRKWTTYGGRRPVANQDLWRELDILIRGFTIEFTWVPGHGKKQEYMLGKVDKMAFEMVQNYVNGGRK